MRAKDTFSAAGFPLDVTMDTQEVVVLCKSVNSNISVTVAGQMANK